MPVAATTGIQILPNTGGDRAAAGIDVNLFQWRFFRF
jgi:hypothetical protein